MLPRSYRALTNWKKIVAPRSSSLSIRGGEYLCYHTVPKYVLTCLLCAKRVKLHAVACAKAASTFCKPST